MNENVFFVFFLVLKHFLKVTKTLEKSKINDQKCFLRVFFCTQKFLKTGQKKAMCSNNWTRKSRKWQKQSGKSPKMSKNPSLKP